MKENNPSIIYFSCFSLVRLFLCIYLFILSLQTIKAQDYRLNKDSLQKIYNSSVSDTLRAKALMDLAGLYAKSNSDTCILLANKALQLSQKANFKRGEVHAINVIGLAYYRKNDYDNALLYYEKVQKNINLLALPPRLGLFLNLGNIYIKRVKYSQALTYYQKAIKIANLLENKQAIAICLNNMGNIHEKQKEYNQALKIYEQSLALKEEIKDKKGIASTLNNIGIIYEKQEQLTTALSYHQKAMKIFEELKDDQGIAMVMNNIATVEKKQKKSDVALEKYQKGLILKEKIGDKRGIIYSLNGIAEVLQEQKKYDESIRTLEKSLVIAKDIEALAEVNNIYNLLVDNYREQGKYQQALFYVDLAKRTNDSIFNLSKAKEIIKLQTAFDVERKEIAFQKQKLVVEQQKIALRSLEEANRNKILALVSLGILVCILIFGGYLFYHNRQLKSQFALLESEQRWRRTQMNPHFFFNALSAIQKFVMQAEPLKATSYIAKFARLMRQVLEQSQDDTISLTEEIETIDNYIQLQQLRFSDKFDYKLVINEDLDTENIVLPPMLVQPIIENAIEHGLADNTEKGFLEVSIQPHTAQNFSICIENTSRGIKSISNETIKPAQHRSFATKIIAERIDLLKKQRNLNISYQVTEKPDQTGRKVEFILPR